MACGGMWGIAVLVYLAVTAVCVAVDRCGAARRRTALQPKGPAQDQHVASRRAAPANSVGHSQCVRLTRAPSDAGMRRVRGARRVVRRRRPGAAKHERGSRPGRQGNDTVSD